MKIDPQTDAFGVIDIQPTFMPGGSLPTPAGEDVIAPINRLLQLPFGVRFATQDWHPAGHISFASSYPGRKPMDVTPLDFGPVTLWPDHALQNTQEAELHKDLDTAAFDLVIRKGARLNGDGVSAFSECGGGVRSGLAPLLRERGIRRVILSGLALDVCVTATAIDAAGEDFAVFVVEDACRASSAAGLAEARQRLAEAGVKMLSEREVTAR